MASAKQQERTVVERRVQMNLTIREAETLYIISRHVAGSPAGRGADIDAIRNALIGAGIGSSDIQSTTEHFFHHQSLVLHGEVQPL